VAGEGQLEAGREDPAGAGLAVVDEDGLREAQVMGHPLTPAAGDLTAIKKDAQRIAPVALLVAKNPEDVELRHSLSPTA
jgi:hypothetical protein